MLKEINQKNIIGNDFTQSLHFVGSNSKRCHSQVTESKFLEIFRLSLAAVSFLHRNRAEVRKGYGKTNSFGRRVSSNFRLTRYSSLYITTRPPRTIRVI